jgi:ATP-binding cassette subfamily C (CFTR/MRP) protein 1
MSKLIEMKRRGKEYSKVQGESTHGKFSIEDEEEEEDGDIELNYAPIGEEQYQSAERRAEENEDKGGFGHCCDCVGLIWSTLTFSWMQELLQKGNKKPLEMEDLYPLSYSDSAAGVYENFKEGWTRELKKPGLEPSLGWAFFHAFGTPFLYAALLKFIHDSALFVGPQLLNALINFLNNPDAPLETGLLYVGGLFLANLVMSICLRQYFWICYRVGMNLRSSVVTAVYSKALVISVAVQQRKTLGEITNLMSVDSSRLQDLTPYLHAIW